MLNQHSNAVADTEDAALVTMIRSRVRSTNMNYVLCVLVNEHDAFFLTLCDSPSLSKSRLSSVNNHTDRIGWRTSLSKLRNT